MKRIGHIAAFAALAMLGTAPAGAQRPQSYDPAVPRGVEQQRVEPAGELARPEPAPTPPRLIQNRTRAERDADARHCLERASNKGIHRCSLPYLPRSARRAAAVKTQTKAAADKPVRIEAAPRADIVKPGAPRPGDAAKAADLVKPMDVTRSGGGAVADAAKAPLAAKPPSGAPTPSTTPAAPAKSAK